MKKMLLLIPSFMGYDTEILRVAQKSFNVSLVNNIKYWKETSDEVYSNLFYKIGRKLKIPRNTLFSLFSQRFVGRYEELAVNTENNADFLFCINGSEMPVAYFRRFKKNNKNAKMILYLWDDVGNLNNTAYIHFFDKVYSYNIEDCFAYGFEYKPMFVQKIENVDNCPLEKKYDIAIIGTAHDCRLEFAKKVYDAYKDQFSFFIYMFHPFKEINWFVYDKPLSFNEYMRILRQSKVVFDIPYNKQRGPTTRAFDAQVTQTKVITTNKEISRYPIYSNNIQIIDKENPVIDKSFVLSPYSDEERQIMLSDEWFDSFQLLE